MNVLGLSGTPRRGGNSEILLDAALDPFLEAGWSAHRFLLSEKSVAPCIGCETCRTSGNCTLNDDMSELYAAYANCDAVVISAPVYWRNVPAQLKAVMDRTYAVSGKHPLMGKPGGAIAIGRSQGGGGQALVLNNIYAFMLSCGMICVPGELNGVSAAADKPGDILRQPRRLEQARQLGMNVLRTATGTFGKVQK